MKRKNILTYCISGLCFLASAVCFLLYLNMTGEETNTAQKPLDRISFAIYGDDEMQRITEDVANVFMRSNNCQVDVYCYSDEDTLNAKALEQASIGTPFDACILDDKTIHQLYQLGWLCDLQEVVKSRKYDGDEYYTAVLKSGEIQGGQYAMPAGVMPMVLCYNTDFFAANQLTDPQTLYESDSWTFEAFVNMLNEVYDVTGQPVLDVDTSWTAVKTWVNCNSTAYPAGEEEIASVLETFGELCRRGAIAFYNTESDNSDFKERFFSGDTKLLLGDLSVTYDTENPYGIGWDIVPIPSPESDFDTCTYWAPMVTVADTPQQELAKEFVDFYVSSYGQKLRLERGECLLPSLNTVFYTSMGNVDFPPHSNYYFFAIENGHMIVDTVDSLPENRALMDQWIEALTILEEGEPNA